MSVAAYPSYRPLGVEWLGDVPSHWHDAPMRHIFRRVKRTGYPSETLLSVYREFGVIEKASRDDNFNNASDDLAGYQLVCPGDLAINKMKAWQGSVAVSTLRGIVSPAYFIYTPMHGSVDKYLHYLLRSGEYTSAYALFSKGVRTGQWDLAPEQHESMKVLLPPIEEQRQIAAYLDRETSKIDELIAKQEQLVTTLTERRQAVITQAVTRGLDPTIQYRDSGVEWLGNIPASWSVKRLKHLGRTQIGLTYDPADIVNEGDGTLVLRSGNVQSGRISLTDRIYVSSAIPQTLVTRPGDILICARNGSRALIGKNAIIDQSVAGATFGAFMSVLRSPIGDYLSWVMSSSIFKHQMGSFVTATINQLTNSTLNNFEIPVPPRSEQLTIVAYLSRATSKNDEITAKAASVIARLRERRQALISAAVTGKIDVRGPA